jgi:hypothetical protein
MVSSRNRDQGETMPQGDRELLRPEEAASWEEFLARCTAEQANCRAAGTSGNALGDMVLAAPLAFGAFLFWAGVAVEHDAGRWFLLVVALFFTWLLLQVLGRAVHSGVSGSKRHTELSRLRKQWQAMAERGEIPQSTPGGPKVWRDELEIFNGRR